jgi:hypothetical protein
MADGNQEVESELPQQDQDPRDDERKGGDDGVLGSKALRQALNPTLLILFHIFDHVNKVCCHSK